MSFGAETAPAARIMTATTSTAIAFHRQTNAQRQKTATKSAEKLDCENETSSPSHNTAASASAARPARTDLPRTMRTAVATSATTRKRP